jgi:hypothetical protein
VRPIQTAPVGSVDFSQGVRAAGGFLALGHQGLEFRSGHGDLLVAGGPVGSGGRVVSYAFAELGLCLAQGTSQLGKPRSAEQDQNHEEDDHQLRRTKVHVPAPVHAVGRRKRLQLALGQLEGTMAILVGDHWIDAPKGSFVLVPAGITHDFENRSAAPAGVLNFSHPGDFEQHMPGIVQWFIDNPPGDAIT